MVAVYQILEQYGMVTSTQGVGTIFTDNAERAARRYLLSDQAVALIRKGHTLDLREEEIAGIFLAALQRIETQRTTETGTIPPTENR